MAKYIALDANGNQTEVLGLTTSTGAPDAGKIPQLDSGGRLDGSVMPSGIGAETKGAIASEALSANDMVNFWNNAGTINVRKADNTTANQGRTADGFVKAAVASGASATVFVDTGAVISGLTGLTPGADYWLAATGGVTATRPTTAGNTLQRVGKAVSATELIFVKETPITLA